MTYRDPHWNSPLDRRRALRREARPPEMLLWSRLRAHRLCGYKFRRKHGIGCYTVDFYCPAAGLAIDIAENGSAAGRNGVQSFRESAREEFLRDMGIKVLRVNDDEVCRDIERLVMVLAEMVAARIRSRQDHRPSGLTGSS